MQCKQPPGFCPSPGSGGCVSDLLSRGKWQICHLPFPELWKQAVQKPNPNQGKRSVPRPRSWGLREALGDPMPKNAVPAEGDPHYWRDAHGGQPCTHLLQLLPLQSAPNPCRGTKQSWEAKGGCAHLRGCLWSPGHSHPAPSIPGCCWCQAAPAWAQPRAATGALVPSDAIVPAHACALSSPNNGWGNATCSQHLEGGEEGGTSLATVSTKCRQPLSLQLRCSNGQNPPILNRAEGQEMLC